MLTTPADARVECCGMRGEEASHSDADEEPLTPLGELRGGGEQILEPLAE